MDAWLIVLITIVSGITLFSILFSIKLRKSKRRAAARNAAYSSTIVVPAQPSCPPQNPLQQMPYNPNPYPQNQSMPYPPQQQQNQQPYPSQMPYPPQQPNQYQQQPNLVTQTQAIGFIPSTNNQPLFNPQNPQQYYSPPQGIIVSTAPYNPSPSAPPVNRY